MQRAKEIIHIIHLFTVPPIPTGQVNLAVARSQFLVDYPEARRYITTRREMEALPLKICTSLMFETCCRGQGSLLKTNCFARLWHYSQQSTKTSWWQTLPNRLAKFLLLADPVQHFHASRPILDMQKMTMLDCSLYQRSIFFSWFAWFLRPKGKWLSLVHQRYITGRELFALMGFPIHRLQLGVVDDSVTWLVYPNSCMTTMVIFHLFPNDHPFGRPRFCMTWQGTAWVSESLLQCWLLLSLQPGLTKWLRTKSDDGEKIF